MKNVTHEVLNWQAFEAACSALSAALSDQEPYDLVVGIARGGMPLAVRLSHLLNCRDFGMISIGRTASEAGFDIQEYTKSTPLQCTANQADRVLIVDDITSSGTTLGHVRDQVQRLFGDDTQCDFAVIFADMTAVNSAGNQCIANRLWFHRDIDNSTVWVDFPWELE